MTLLPGILNAQVLDDRWYISPQVSYGFFDDDSGLDDDIGYGGWVGKPLGRLLNVELQGFQFQPDLENSSFGESEGEITGYGLTLLFIPNRDRSYGFGLFGVADGTLETGPVDFNDDGIIDSAKEEFDTVILDVGLGYIHEFTEHGIGLRGEYRFRYSDVSDAADDLSDHIVTLALHIPLGARPTAPQPPPPKPAAPAPAPPPEPEPEPDLESREPIVLKGVKFDFDKATLRPESKTILDRAIRTLKDKPKVDVLVAGHTDAIGTEQYNQGLSERRAKAVYDYLVAGGVNAGRLTTKGFGESEPIAPNQNPDGTDNPEGRQENRRVELQVQYEEAPPPSE